MLFGLRVCCCDWLHFRRSVFGIFGRVLTSHGSSSGAGSLKLQYCKSRDFQKGRKNKKGYVPVVGQYQKLQKGINQAESHKSDRFCRNFDSAPSSQEERRRISSLARTTMHQRRICWPGAVHKQATHARRDPSGRYADDMMITTATTHDYELGSQSYKARRDQLQNQWLNFVNARSIQPSISHLAVLPGAALTASATLPPPPHRPYCLTASTTTSGAANINYPDAVAAGLSLDTTSSAAMIVIKRYSPNPTFSTFAFCSSHITNLPQSPMCV